MRRQSCGSCHFTNLRTVLDLGDSPLANDFPISPDETQQRYPLELLRCIKCSLVQLSEVVPDEDLWNSNYGFYTGCSWVAVEHQKRYAQQIMRLHPRLCQQGVLEIACNDGTMLKHFQEAGYPALGVDPAQGPATQARNNGLDVWIEPFGSTAALRIVTQHGHQGIVIANNVIAHVADLDDFLEGLAIVLGAGGLAVIEFQYLADLITGNQIDHVYHEHRQFFSLYSLKYALARHGLHPASVAQTGSQGGSLRVVISRHRFWDQSINNLLETEKWLQDEHALTGLQGRADRIKYRLREMLWEQKQAGKRVAGYGASAKSTTLLNFCEIGPDLVQYVVDTTPTKHGRYTSGTGIPIIDPRSDSRAPDTYLSMIHNYQGEIMRQEPQFTGRWIMPIPTPVLL